MIITPKFDCATGQIDTDQEKLLCVGNFKNKTVYIGFKATGSIVCCARTACDYHDKTMTMHCGLGNGGDEPYALHCKKYKPAKLVMAPWQDTYTDNGPGSKGTPTP